MSNYLLAKAFEVSHEQKSVADVLTRPFVPVNDNE